MISLVAVTGVELVYNARCEFEEIHKEVSYSSRKSYREYVTSGREMVDRLYEDAIYSVEATVGAKKVAIMADHLYYYRRNVEHSITYDEDASRKHEEDFLIAQSYIQDVYRQEGISTEAWTEYARYFAEYAYMHQREVRPKERFFAFFDVVREMACPDDGPQLFELWHDDPHPWRNAYLGFVRNNQPALAWAEAKALNAAGHVLGRR